MHQDSTDSTARVAVAFDVADDAVELFADRLFAAGASAVAEMPCADGLVTLVADLDLAGLDLVTRSAASSRTAPTPRLRLIEPEVAWNQGWREFARAWQCGDRVVLRPEWVSAPAEPSTSVTLFAAADRDATARDAAPDQDESPEPIEVVIEPGQAFGSGSHITTRLCAALLDGCVHGGERVLDVGCGTGVLGVAAAMLGADSVTGVDIDPEAVRVAQLVGERNGVRSRMRVSVAPLARVEGVFELVLANLLLPIISELGVDLASRVAPGGCLIASGVLVEQQAGVVSALAPLRLDRVTTADGWVAMVFRSPGVP